MALKYFKIILNSAVFLLIIFSSIEWGFKLLLILLLGLEYRRQQINEGKENKIIALEVRDKKLFLKHKNNPQFYPVLEINLKQNRIFAELELHLNDQVISEFICRDRFTSQYHYCSFMQYLRFNR